MIFTWKYRKEAQKKAKEDCGYFTAEMITGYLMVHHPVAFILDTVVPVAVILLGMYIGGVFK